MKTLIDINKFRGGLGAGLYFASGAGALCFAVLSGACYGPMRYLEGEPLPGALPDPTYRIFELRDNGDRARTAEGIELSGTVARLVEKPAPSRGFRLILQGGGPKVDREWVVEVDTFTLDAEPDLSTGEEVRLNLGVDGGGSSLEIVSADGTAFWLWSGEFLPAPGRFSEPVVPVGMRGEAFEQVGRGSGVCLNTWSHRLVEFKADEQHFLLAPGGSVIVPAGGRTYRVVLFDARVLDETDCAEKERDRVSFAVVRIAPPSR